MNAGGSGYLYLVPGRNTLRTGTPFCDYRYSVATSVTEGIVQPAPGKEPEVKPRGFGGTA